MLRGGGGDDLQRYRSQLISRLTSSILRSFIFRSSGDLLDISTAISLKSLGHEDPISLTKKTRFFNNQLRITIISMNLKC